MRRARKTSLANANTIAVGNSAPKPRAAAPVSGWRAKLSFGKSSGQLKLKDRDLVFILRNLSTLTSSGVPLPKALSTLAEEKALEKHSEMLHLIRRKLENGEAFSTALAQFGDTFNPVMVNQIKVGEHSGTLGETLTTIARHCEDGNKLKAEIIRKLDREGLSVRKAQSLTGIAAADFSRIRNADLGRFTIDRLMMTVNRLGSRIDVAVKFRRATVGRHTAA